MAKPPSKMITPSTLMPQIGSIEYTHGPVTACAPILHPTWAQRFGMWLFGLRPYSPEDDKASAALKNVDAELKQCDIDIAKRRLKAMLNEALFVGGTLYVKKDAGGKAVLFGRLETVKNDGSIGIVNPVKPQKKPAARKAAVKPRGRR